MDFRPKCTLGALSLAILVLFSRSFAHGGNIIYKGNSTVDEGEPFIISCFLTLFDPVQWEKNGKAIMYEPGVTSDYSFYEETVEGKVMASLIVKAALPHHSGSYRCNTLSKESHQIYVMSADPIKGNTDFNHFKVLEYAEALDLYCNTTNESQDSVMKWFKNDQPVNASTGPRPNIVIKGNSLRIAHAMQDDVANYSCRLVNSKNNSIVIEKFDFEVVGRPYVKLPETITVVEEEKLKLECIVIASHNPYVEWKVGEEVYSESKGRVKLSTDPEKKVLNAVMELDPAQMSDRGEVSCIAHNQATTIREPMVATIYVRVKDKYAALWPFLGICAEVIVLCTVIFIYEKKRNKSELEESDTDQSPEQKNTPDHGKDSVRQRK